MKYWLVGASWGGLDIKISFLLKMVIGCWDGERKINLNNLKEENKYK